MLSYLEAVSPGQTMSNHLPSQHLAASAMLISPYLGPGNQDVPLIQFLEHLLKRLAKVGQETTKRSRQQFQPAGNPKV